MKVIALFGRGNTGKTHCLGHLINLLHQETKGCNYLFEGQNERVTLNYLGQRVTICTWGDTYHEESLNVEKIRNDNPDIAIVATRKKGATVRIVEKFCNKNGHQLKWVEKYVASFDDLSGQEYLNNLQAVQLLDYVRGLIEGQLYYVDSISKISEENALFHVTLLGVEMPHTGYPRTLSLELNEYQLFYQNSKQLIQEDDFVLYRPGNDNQFLYGNETPQANALRNETRYLRQYLTERELHGEAAIALIQWHPDVVKSYHVKVGHGNCSLVLLAFGSHYDLWMVDCSTYDYLIRRDYSKCLYQCLLDIAGTLNIELGDLRISRFMLTHTHFDHYNGLSYLIKKGFVDENTVIYANLHYDCSSPIWKSILEDLKKIRCRFVEPIHGNIEEGAIHIMHPECRIYKNKSSIQNGIVNRVVPKVNDSSIVYEIEIDDRTMVFPGDLEQNGFKTMTAEGTCQPQLFYADYYVVSHHGSINGHPAMTCMNLRKGSPTPLDCVTNNLKKAILMGRNGAYSGIYDQDVISYWGALPGVLEYTEKAKHYLELDWKCGMVDAH